MNPIIPSENQVTPTENKAAYESSSDDEVPIVAQTNKIEVTFGKKMPPDQRKATNKVRTTKYTLLNWAPYSLLFQFKRAANVYFLIISILTLMPFSPKKPASMIGTFAMVLFFTMLKEAYEDF